MAACRFVLNLLAIAVALAGPMPLWLHHATCHGPGCAAHRDAPASHAHCDHHHACHAHHGAADETMAAHDAVSAEDAREQGGESERVVASHDHHACFVCFQLAQSSMAAIASATSVAVPMAIAGPQRIVPIYLDAVGGPNPPRGPPGGSLSC